MKRKDDARDILWFLNKKKPMPAAESETPLAADCSAVTSRIYVTYVLTAHAQSDVWYVYNTHAN